MVRLRSASIVVVAAIAVALQFGVVTRSLRSGDQVPAQNAVTPAAVPSTMADKRIEVPLNGHVFSLPEGFTIELVAGPPLVDRPITASFDEEGRLYVSDSSGTNDKVQKQLEDKPHRVVRLEDTDGDGKFDKSIVFADKLMFPEGTLWHDGSLYVAAPPSIWKLTDTDGDGVADKREEWFKGNTLTGCANDLHGPYLGPDGYLYWCKGAFAEQTYERPVRKLTRSASEGERSSTSANANENENRTAEGGHPTEKWVTKASHIFRARPDAPRDPETGSIKTSAIECVMTGGMDNPVDVVFTPTGERIFSSTFLVHPGGGQRDGLAHAVYGGVYGKDWSVIDSPSHPRTGDVMPVLCHLGAAAPCGLERLQSAAWGREYQDNLFACCFNMRKVTRHVLTPKGETFQSWTHDFVVSNNLDFHPTDVLEDPDDGLLIVDTGGWYKLCCPTSQLWKPEVLGAIYRVRKKPTHETARHRRATLPFGREIEWDQLTIAEPSSNLLAANLDQLCRLIRSNDRVVQDRATRIIEKLGEPAVRALSERIGAAPDDAPTVVGLVWALGRINDRSARKTMHSLLGHRRKDIRAIAAHYVSLWKDNDAVPDLMKHFSKGPIRIFAEALGRAVAENADDRAAELAVHTLLKALNYNHLQDRFFQHSITYAVIEISKPSATRRVLESPEFAAWSCALIALDQMPNGGLKPEEVAKYLTSPEPLLRETAAWIISRHADWGEALAGYLRKRLASPLTRSASEGERSTGLTAEEQTTLGKQLAQFAKAASVQDLLATTARDAKLPTPARLTALRAMRDSGLKELPKTWTAALLAVLGENNVALIEVALKTARTIPPHKDDAAAWRAPLLQLANGGRQPPGGPDVKSPPAAKEPGGSRLPFALRLDALAALPGGLAAKETDDKLFDFVLSQLAPELPVAQRGTAAEVLSKAKLSKPQLEKLTEQFATAGPLEVDRLLGAFEQTTDEQVGQKLVAALKTAPALTALRADAIKTRLAKYSPSVQEAAQPLYAALSVDLAAQKQRLEEVLASLPPGDIVRGQLIFNSEKAACKACHAMGYLGGKTGPDLTRIGGIRTERDLLESILFPSASFVRSFEPVLIETQDGRTLNGLIRSETAEELVLATGPNQEARVARADIEEMRPSNVSIMPAGLEKQLTLEQLADLIAFLKAAK